MSGLEQFLIFTRGGLILWSLTTAALKFSPIDALIRSCLLEDRSVDSSFTFNAGAIAYTLKWAFNNELGLVFVAVAIQQLSHLLPLEQLLTSGRQHFSDIYEPKQTSYPGFDETFRRIQQDAEAKVAENRISNQAARPALTPAKKNVSMMPAVMPEKGTDKGGETKDGADKAPGCNPDFVVNRDTIVAPTDGGAFDVSKLQKLGARKGSVKKGKPGPKNKGPKVPVKNASNVHSEDLKLDFTDPVGKGGVNDVVEVAVVGNLGESGMDRDDEVGGIESEEEEEEGNEKPGAKKKGWFSSMFKSISGNTNLEKSDLEPALKALKDRLMTKNVAEEIAEKLCDSVAASLEGKKLASFTRVSSTVQAAMEEALLRILTPRRSIDILREVHDAKEKGRPYVIVFVGVNGVGKSTNLAKVAYWLQQHDISVMLAACDTFRSGAVEQLRVHACRLKVDIFERGYEKDPAMVAKAAIEEARHINGVTGVSKADVVLVDTAGRMQDNEPLMRALSKLVNLNNPDLVLFVGEALVGNDAVDQLTKFNQKLIDLSATKSGRSIDGILLTKFDTIDDKVGAALSMVYISRAPVMFVGCGQSYTDLKKLNVKTIVKTLLT